MLLVLLSLASTSLALPRDVFKPKTPSVSHSIINLGKIDVNVYMDKNHNKKALEELFQPDLRRESPKSQYEIVHPLRSQPVFKPDVVLEECPCTGSRSVPVPSASNPVDLISKLLMNHDLFSSHSDPSSSLCCTSHEQVQEEYIIEFGSKPFPVQSAQNQDRPSQPRAYFTQPQQPAQMLPKVFPYLPFITDSFSNKGPNQKSNQIEILLFPTKNGKKDFKSRSALRSDIQVVGDKKTTMLYEVYPTKASVKKDLAKDKVDAEIATETPKVNASGNHPNII